MRGGGAAQEPRNVGAGPDGKSCADPTEVSRARIPEQGESAHAKSTDGHSKLTLLNPSKALFIALALTDRHSARPKAALFCFLRRVLALTDVRLQERCKACPLFLQHHPSQGLLSGNPPRNRWVLSPGCPWAAQSSPSGQCCSPSPPSYAGKLCSLSCQSMKTLPFSSTAHRSPACQKILPPLFGLLGEGGSYNF